jgi:hypothetical protein
MRKSVRNSMKGSAIRALCVAGAFAYAAGSASADTAAQTNQSLDLSGYKTVVDQNSAPRARLAGQFDLGLQGTLPVLSYGPEQISQIGFSDSIARLPVFDGVTLDFGSRVDLAGKFNRFDAAGSDAYDGLFFSASAVNAPYASIASGGSLIGLTASLTKDLQFSIGSASLSSGSGFDWTSPGATVAQTGGAPSPFDTRNASALLSGVSWNFASWGGLGLNASQTTERDGVLGAFDTSVQTAKTSSVGVAARVQLGGGWMTTASFAEAITKLDLKPGLGVAPDDLHTRSYGIAIAKRGLFGNDTMGLAVTRPAPGGNDDLTLVSGIDGRPQFLQGDHLLDSRAPETDFELGYVTTFLDGAVALQTNAAYQMNFAGQSGVSSVSLLSRAKIKF